MPSLLKSLLPESEGVASLVGAGGKTALMFRLAKELSENGESVLTTTTTKIFMPTGEQSAHIVVSADPEEALGKAGELMKSSYHITVGREHLVPENKLVGFGPDAIGKFWESGLFRWILVEADGAAQRPLKAPADHEPVIPECSTHVVAVVGLDAVGEPLTDRWVFRPDIYSQMSGLPLNSPITERSVAVVILDHNGMIKGCPSAAKRCVFLNKADDESAFAAGRRIASILREESKGSLERILIGSVRKEPPVVEIFEADVA